MLTNVRTILKSDLVDAAGGARTVAYVIIAALWAAAVLWSLRAYRAEKAELDAEAEEAPVAV